MNRKIFITAAVVGVLLLAGGFFYWRFTSSPKYALLQISRAVENHDTQTFQQYVEMDHITSNVVDQTISLFSHEQGGGLWQSGQCL